MPQPHVQRRAACTYLIADSDAALAWFTEKLGFALVSDETRSETKRWELLEPTTG